MSQPVLLYDGACGLCVGSVRFVLRRDRRGTLRFASFDGGFGRSVLERHHDLRGLDTVVWYEPAGKGRPERLLTRSSAVLRVLRYLGGPWRLGLVAHAVPRGVRDALYRLLARHRRRLFPAEACLLPSPEHRHRFLE
jgi:predicted DCC family thiol-disulfide oxidoreductase YuxK